MRSIFPKLYGNDAIKARLGRAIVDGRLPHALLIDGQEGSGKTTLAKEICAALVCEHRTDEGYSLPCHICASCKKVMNDGYVDLHVTERAEGKATIGVSEIKAIRRDTFLSATEGSHKMYIVKDAERMTPEAQNALLIALEEPPEGVVIMLLARGTDRILTTIKSRAQHIALARFAPKEISDYLVRTDKTAERISREDPEGFRIAVSASDGRIGIARRLIEPSMREGVIAERGDTLNIIKALGNGRSFREAYEAVMALPTKRPELAASLERLISALGDLIKLKYAGEGVTFSFFTDADEADGAGGRISSARLFRLYETVSSAYDYNYKNANTSALLMTLAARLGEA